MSNTSSLLLFIVYFNAIVIPNIVIIIKKVIIIIRYSTCTISMLLKCMSCQLVYMEAPKGFQGKPVLTRYF